MDFIFFGIQGSGKGTQGKILAEKNDLAYFETGGQLRRLASEDTELGRKVKSIIEAGNLVSDEVVIEIVRDFLHTIPATKRVIFDGIPRKEKQRAMLEELLFNEGRNTIGVLIHIPEEEAKRRLLSRWMSRKTGKIYPSREMALIECSPEDVYQRTDDNEQAIQVRIDNFKKETLPVIEWYRAQNRLVEIDGTKPVAGVTEELFSKVANVN